MQAPVSCKLCPLRGGAFKSCSGGSGWVHVQCAVWVPEVRFGIPETLDQIEGLDEIPEARRRLGCSLCRKAGRPRRHTLHGAAIQCAAFGCVTAFHATCAQRDGLHCRTISPNQAGEALCPKHDPVAKSPVIPSVGDLKISDADRHPRTVAELDVQSLCAVTFEDSGVYRNLPRESAQLVNGFPKTAEEEAAVLSRNVPVRVKWADGHTYDATMIGEYQLAMAELQGDTADNGFTIPAVSLEDPSAGQRAAKMSGGVQRAAKSSGGAGGAQSKRRHNGSGSGSKELDLIKGMDWLSLLKGYAGEEVVCWSSGHGEEARGTLVFGDATKPVIRVSDNGAEKDLTLMGFEAFAKCKHKNPKLSIFLASENISLGQAAVRCLVKQQPELAELRAKQEVKQEAKQEQSVEKSSAEDVNESEPAPSKRMRVESGGPKIPIISLG